MSNEGELRLREVGVILHLRKLIVNNQKTSWGKNELVERLANCCDDAFTGRIWAFEDEKEKQQS